MVAEILKSPCSLMVEMAPDWPNCWPVKSSFLG